MDKYLFVIDSASFKNKVTNPRGPRPKVCDRCNFRKVKCVKEAENCNNCIKSGLSCTYERWKKKKDSGKDLIATSNKVNPNKRIKVYTTNDNSKISPIKDNNSNTIKLSFVNKGIWTKCFINSIGEQIYLGNSMATFYFISNSYMLLKKRKAILNTFQLSIPLLKFKRKFEIRLDSRLIFQLIVIYFARVNHLFPATNKKRFFKLLKKNDQRPSFLALLTAICLTGVAFYPDRDLAKMVSNKLSEAFLFYMRQCYTKPDSLVLQACTIASYHTSLTTSDSTLTYCWQILGIAHRMCIQRGLHVSNGLKKSKNQALEKTYQISTMAEVILGYCFGRAYYPPFYYELFKIQKEILPFKSFLDAGSCLMSIMDNIRLHIEPFTPPIVNKSSLSCILNDKSNNPLKSLRSYNKYKEIENLIVKWYQQFIYSFDNKEKFSVYEIKTDRNGVLMLFFLSVIVDLNRPFIAHNDTLSFTNEIFKESILINTYFEAFNPFEKVFYASVLGTHLLKSNAKIIDSSLPMHWYAFLQFSFIFVLALDKIDLKETLLRKTTKEYLLFYYDLFNERSNQWVIMKDIFLVSKPFIESYLK